MGPKLQVTKDESLEGRAGGPPGPRHGPGRDRPTGYHDHAGGGRALCQPGMRGLSFRPAWWPSLSARAVFSS